VLQKLEDVQRALPSEADKLLEDLKHAVLRQPAILVSQCPALLGLAEVRDPLSPALRTMRLQLANCLSNTAFSRQGHGSDSPSSSSPTLATDVTPGVLGGLLSAPLGVASATAASCGGAHSVQPIVADTPLEVRELAVPTNSSSQSSTFLTSDTCQADFQERGRLSVRAAHAPEL
jgi:hypothetical protein